MAPETLETGSRLVAAMLVLLLALLELFTGLRDRRLYWPRRLAVFASVPLLLLFVLDISRRISEQVR